MQERYTIRCTPGGLLKDENSGEVIYFNSYAEAEAEALRQKIEAAQPDMAGLKAGLLARLAEKQGGDTPAPQ